MSTSTETSGGAGPSRTATVVTAFLALAASYVTLGSFEFVLVAMQTDLGFSVDSANALTFLPAAASLLVVFIAGALGDRWGARRMLVLAVMGYILGAAVVGLAPTLTWVTVGRVLDGAAGAAMAIVALSVLNSTVTEPRQRARVFAGYAAIIPAVFMIAPSMSALVVQWVGWRAGVVPWIVLGCITVVATVRFIPHQPGDGGGEIITPALAGLALAGAAFAVSNLATSLRDAAVAAGIAVVSLLAFVIVRRRTSNPALDLTWCRQRGMGILLVALAVSSMPNLFFYTDLLLQYRYNEPLVKIALLLIIVQVFGVVGGLLSAPVSQRLGPPRSALIALLACAVTSLATLLVTPHAPIWVPVAALAVSALPVAFVVGPITETLMDRAPAHASGSASSVRKATTAVGRVVGGAVVGALSFGAFQRDMTDILSAQGLPAQEAELIATQIRNGAVVDDLAVGIPRHDIQQLLIAKGSALLEAQSTAFVTMGVVSAALFLLSAVLMWLYIRRMRGALL